MTFQEYIHKVVALRVATAGTEEGTAILVLRTYRPDLAEQVESNPDLYPLTEDLIPAFYLWTEENWIVRPSRMPYNTYY